LHAVRSFRNRVKIICNREREVTLLITLARYKLFLELFNDYVCFLNPMMKLTVYDRKAVYAWKL